MPRASFIVILLIIVFVSSLDGIRAQSKKAGIGLTLSGGGAKGLAHIGLLKAIDSAELNIDYLSGASMGSIIGGLYAAGYSGDSIEAIARNIDWDVLLSNTIPMTSYTMEEKGEYGKYAVELPIKNRKIGLPAGFLESQELWLTLEEYFFPVAAVKDFNKLNIPFRCIGTDLATGDAVYFNTGSLVQSIRASMAIPGVFSPVDIGGRRFVDGGVVRNFPVKDVKEMGATYTIGVSVSTPLKNAAELNDAVKVLTQVVFLNEDKDRIEESKICDLVINVPMGDYTAASFDASDALIDLGIEEGRKYYPIFKRMADSLKALYPDYKFVKNRLPAVSNYKISRVEVAGLNKFGKDAFLSQIARDTTKMITFDQLQKDTRNAFAFRMYKCIVCELHADSTDIHTLFYQVQPESGTMLKAGLSQNSFTGFGVQLNLTGRNLLSPFSRTMLSVNIGQNFRGLFEHYQTFGYNRPWSNRFQVYSEFQDVPTFDDFRKIGLYKLKYVTIDDRFQMAARRRSAGGIGMQWELTDVIPQVQSGLYFKGRNNYFQLYGFWQFNNLSKPQYPKKGTSIELKGGYVFNIRPDFDVYRDGLLVGTVTKDLVQYGNYLRVTASLQNTTPLQRKWAWTTRFNGGTNLSGNETLLNGFFAGGMNPTFRNQVQFAGLKEAEVVSESMLSLQTGPRFNPFGGLYITLVGSVLTYDFIPKATQTLSQKWIAGSGLTLAYDLPIGPVEFSLMYCNKTGGIRSYFNFGFPFKL
jgi:NTE family protein